MNETIYEAAMWHDIESNKMHLKKEGEHYVADAMLLRESISLRQENESLKKENDSLRKERDHWHVEQVHAYGNWEDAHKRASELEAENARLKRRLEILNDHGIEIADAVAGGFEIYDKEHARADRLQAENSKLRELVHRYVEYTSQDCCEGCVFKSRCNDSEVDECWQLTEIRVLARELRIEVKE